MISLKSLLTRIQVTPRSFLYASRSDIRQEINTDALILFARNEGENIYYRVTSALRSVDVVVVIDQGSDDGTSYFAAEAGAIVVAQETGQSRESALQEAFRVARRLARSVQVCG